MQYVGGKSFAEFRGYNPEGDIPGVNNIYWPWITLTACPFQVKNAVLFCCLRVFMVVCCVEFEEDPENSDNSPRKPDAAFGRDSKSPAPVRKLPNKEALLDAAKKLQKGTEMVKMSKVANDTEVKGVGSHSIAGKEK